MSIAEKRFLVEPNLKEISVERQCELIGIDRSTYYYKSREESELNLRIMRLIDEEYTKHPFYGSRRMTAYLIKNGLEVGRKRISRLMRLMGIEAIYQKPNLSKPNAENRIYPYLLRGLIIKKCNQVWSTDITYIPMKKGFLYLTAVMDWYSRYVLSWRISSTLDVDFCLEALEEAFLIGIPEIFNTDQGAQFTSNKFVAAVRGRNIAFSMDGKGRASDNVFVERLWRSVKYEDVYLKDYQDGIEVYHGLAKYFDFYNKQRPHQSLNYKTPAEAHGITIN